MPLVERHQAWAPLQAAFHRLPRQSVPPTKIQSNRARPDSMKHCQSEPCPFAYLDHGRRYSLLQERAQAPIVEMVGAPVGR